MAAPEKYLRPEVIRQVARLDLRARFIVEGFLAGLHASPFQGFSVEFSEHRKYVPGDDLKDLDWNVFAKTDKYYLKKFQAETNVTGYLAMDLERLDGLHLPPGIDQVRLLHLPGRGARLPDDPPAGPGRAGGVRHDDQGQPAAAEQAVHLGSILSVLANLKPTGTTDAAAALHQLAAMVRGKSLVMLFSDLLTDPEPVLAALHHLRHRGHEVIVFHVLDEAEVHFPFTGLVEFEDVETPDRMTLDAQGMCKDYLQAVAEFRDKYRTESPRCRSTTCRSTRA